MTYNEYHAIVNAGIDPAELTVFPLADFGLDLAEDGLYARLWRLQQESSSWTVPADRGDAADVPTGR